MKKIFTLIAMAAMAIGASAQESWLVDANTEPAGIAGFDYKATDNVKLYLGDSEYGNVAALNGEGGDFTFDNFTHYFSGSNNPVSGSSTKYSLTNHTLPTTGAYYVLKPSAAGSLQVGMVLNSNKDFYVVDGDGIALSEFDIKDNEGKVVALNSSCKTDVKVYGKVTFNVEAGKSYYVFCNGSKLGLAGFVFSTTAATIDPATTAACKKAIDDANPNNQGGGDDPEQPATDGTFILSFEGVSAGNVLNYANGFKLQITGNTTKEYSGASKITIDGNEYITIKLSNGAQNTLTLPEGKIAEGITFFSYVNKDAATERDSYWKEVAGTSYTEIPSGGNFKSYKDLANPDECTYSFNGDKLNVITFTNTGEQCCFVIKVSIATGEVVTGIETIKNETINLNAPMFNLAGQKVAEGYKGVVIQNGRKVVK